VAAGLLAFTLSIDDFVISFFTSGPTSLTLPIYIYGSLRRHHPEVHALSTVIFLVTVLLVVLLQLVVMRTGR
jgi:spermidine/putrescine transport system permease protein